MITYHIHPLDHYLHRLGHSHVVATHVDVAMTKCVKVPQFRDPTRSKGVMWVIGSYDIFVSPTW
jgi:hypothetical protein